jgi:hypothetical protein
MAGFAAGAALAGMVVGAARITGVVDASTAAADEPAAPAVERTVTAAKPPAEPERKASGAEGERWRGKGRGSSDVPAGVLARVASRRELERGGSCAPRAPERVGPPEEGADRCPPESDGIESVEIDWNGSSAAP